MTQVRNRAVEVEQREAAAIPPYSMRLVWDPDDALFVVTVPELPGCVTHGATRAEAIERGENAIAMWLRAARHWGTPIPKPVVEGHIEDRPSVSKLSDAEQGLFRYMAQTLALRPDAENIPDWVQDDLRALLGKLEAFTLAEVLALLISGELPDRTRLWLMDVTIRAVATRQALTGEDPPPLPWLGQERRSG
jgi:predicted RNase H-like HicB family nuclease